MTTPYDPYVFGPPGSGSVLIICMGMGKGADHFINKPTNFYSCLTVRYVLLTNVLSLETYLNVPTVSNKQKT
jgi:hypothetical protein